MQSLVADIYIYIYIGCFLILLSLCEHILQMPVCVLLCLCSCTTIMISVGTYGKMALIFSLLFACLSGDCWKSKYPHNNSLKCLHLTSMQFLYRKWSHFSLRLYIYIYIYIYVAVRYMNISMFTRRSVFGI